MTIKTRKLAENTHTETMADGGRSCGLSNVHLGFACRFLVVVVVVLVVLALLLGEKGALDQLRKLALALLNRQVA